MPFPVRLPPPSTTAAAAAATVGAILAAVTLRRYLSASRHRPSARASMSAAAGAATTLVAYGKSAQEQELLASAAGSVALEEGEPAGEVSVTLYYEGAGFDAAAYMSALQARRFGRWMLWTPRVGSTQDLIVRNFTKLPVGVVCVADVQFKGRGRSKNVWESPPGCLMFSFTSQMLDARKLPLMQYVVCLSITEAIKELCRSKGLPELDVRIKWPNDLYLKGLKVGGILCTSSYEPKVYNICTGRSKNVWESPPGCLMFSFTSQMLDARKLPLMQYVICLSITEAIKELCRAKGLPELDVRIKWPNDLYLEGLKVGGVLCTSSYEPKVYNICTGVGLNVDNEKPTTCLNAALQEANPTSPILK